MEDKYLSRRLNIFEYAEQHKGCSEHTNEYEVNGKMYIVHSHFVGQKDIDNVLYNNNIDDIKTNRNKS